jgi:hypothetical protein
MVEVAAENNSTTIFPVPIDLLTPFMEMAKRAAGVTGATGGTEAPKTLQSTTGTPVPATDRERTRTP